MPPLLKAYMRLGAKICGEPCWDEDFQVADVFILLKRDDLCPLKQVREFYARTHDPKELIVIDGADHLFDGKVGEVADAIEDLLGDYE